MRFLTMDSGPYAWVKGEARMIYHAGYVRGDGKGMAWLVGAGVKGYPAHGVWVSEEELIPLEEARGLRRHPDSLTERAKRRHRET